MGCNFLVPPVRDDDDWGNQNRRVAPLSEFARRCDLDDMAAAAADDDDDLVDNSGGGVVGTDGCWYDGGSSIKFLALLERLGGFDSDPLLR
jgi:hypothetical protein